LLAQVIFSVQYKNIFGDIFNEIKCRVNTSLGLVGGMHPPPVSALGSNACVCLYSPLKLLTDDQVTSQRFNWKHINCLV